MASSRNCREVSVAKCERERVGEPRRGREGEGGGRKGGGEDGGAEREERD